MFSRQRPTTQQSFKTAALSLAAMLGCWSAQAASPWDYSARASLNANYNDNPTLQSDNSARSQVDFLRFLASYEMDIERLSDRSTFIFNPRITRDYYPDSDFEDLQNTDIFLRGSTSWQNPRTSWSLTFQADRQNILSNENTVAEGGDNVLNPFRADDIQYTYALSPSFSWVISDKDQVTFGVSGRVVDFDLDYTGRSDFETVNANVSYRRGLTQKQSLGFSGFIGFQDSEGINCREDLETPPQGVPPDFNYGAQFDACLPENPNPANRRFVNAINTNETDNVSLTADWQYLWTRNTSIVGRFGWQRADSTQEIRDSNGKTLIYEFDGTSLVVPTVPIEIAETEFSSTTYDISINNNGKRTNTTLTLRRGVTPSQRGTPQDRYQINLNTQYEFSSRLTGELRLQAFSQESIFIAGDDDLENLERIRFFSVAANLSRSISRNWSTSGNCRFRQRRRNDTAKGFDCRIGVSYIFKRIDDR